MAIAPSLRPSVVTVIKPGMLTTIQDTGRWGFQSRGVPVAGPMDPVSHRVNALVGNDRGAAALEVTLLGPELEFNDERLVAVAGAVQSRSTDGPPPQRAVHRLGRIAPALRRARPRRARAYPRSPAALPSRPCSGADRRIWSARWAAWADALVAGDRLPLGDQGACPGCRSRRRARPSRCPALMRRFASCPAAGRILPPMRSRCYGRRHAIDHNSVAWDSGWKVRGWRTRGADIISDATRWASCRCLPPGQPILLMADRQTSGGYPKIATVIAADIAIAGQLGPADTISFEVCTLADAMAALIAQERALMAVEARRT
jgi:hypothetical protein